MEPGNEISLLAICRKKIEEKLDWDASSDWTTEDFTRLSREIYASTGVNLSVATLKRLWGKVRYDSKPTATTLNALSQFLGFAHWRDFKRAQLEEPTSNQTPIETGHLSPKFVTRSTPSLHKLKPFLWLGSVSILLIAMVWMTGFGSERHRQALDKSLFSFDSKKVVDKGVPNTVIFDYDATAAGKDDTIFIQQSWDPTLRKRVRREDRHHTSIYYYPGFFQAKLVINDEVMKEHPLLITTEGWMLAIEHAPVPVYFPFEEGHRQGSMGITTTMIEAAQIPMQPEVPWVTYLNVGNFKEDINSSDLLVETRLINDYGEGAGVCQHTEIKLMFENAAIVIPLSVPGCVSELSFFDRDGKRSDLSMLGTRFSDWVTVRCRLKGTQGTIVVNEGPSLDFAIPAQPFRLVGISYRFQGTGRVSQLRIGTTNGDVKYEDTF